MSEGRLLTAEFEQRLEACFSARTYAQLDAVLADLPGRRLLAQREPHKRALVGPALVAAIAVPAAVVAVIVIVLAITGVFAGWMLWLAVGLWFFGRRRSRVNRAHYASPPHVCGGWHKGHSPARGDWA